MIRIESGVDTSERETKLICVHRSKNRMEIYSKALPLSLEALADPGVRRKEQ